MAERGKKEKERRKEGRKGRKEGRKKRKHKKEFTNLLQTMICRLGHVHGQTDAVRQNTSGGLVVLVSGPSRGSRYLSPGSRDRRLSALSRWARPSHGAGTAPTTYSSSFFSTDARPSSFFSPFFSPLFFFFFFFFSGFFSSRMAGAVTEAAGGGRRAGAARADQRPGADRALLQDGRDTH